MDTNTVLIGLRLTPKLVEKMDERMNDLGIMGRQEFIRLLIHKEVN